MTVETSLEVPVVHSAKGLVTSDCYREAAVDQAATCSLPGVALVVLHHMAAVHIGSLEGSFRSVADSHHSFVDSTLGLTF